MLAWLDQQLEVVAAAIGFPADQLAMVLCLFVNYPLGLFFLRLLGSGVPTSLRHLFSIVPSIAFGVWLFGWDLVHSFVSSLLGYMLLYVYAHRSTACPKLMFFYAMAYVAASHIYSMYYSYMDWHLDFTRPQMIITIKLTTLAYNLSDARFREQEDLSSHEKEKQVKKMPSLLEFMGYIYFFPSFLAGPHIYFADYKKFIEGMLHPMGKNQPSTLLPAARKMGEAFLCIALAAPLVAIMPTSHLCTNDYAAQGFLYKLGYLYLAAVGARFSFYFAWLLSEGSFIACGLGYNGTTKNPRTGKEEIKWDRCNNVDVLGWELGTSPRSCIASWNRQVQQWLYNYVYVRSFYTVEVFDEKTQKKIKITKRAWYSTLLTNLLSAFWHGFYPGYYLGFGSMSFVVEAARILRATLRHRVVIMSPVEAMKKAEGETEAETVAEDSPAGKAKEAKPLKPAPTTSAPKMVERPTWIKPLYDLGSWVLTQTSISLCMSSFLVLELSCSLQVWNALFWWAHIGCAVLLAASNLGFLRQFEERRASKTA